MRSNKYRTEQDGYSKFDSHLHPVIECLVPRGGRGEVLRMSM